MTTAELAQEIRFHGFEVILTVNTQSYFPTYTVRCIKKNVEVIHSGGNLHEIYRIILDTIKQ